MSSSRSSARLRKRKIEENEPSDFQEPLQKQRKIGVPKNLEVKNSKPTSRTISENNNVNNDHVKKEDKSHDSDDQKSSDDDSDWSDEDDEDGPSAYELERLNNIKANEEFFKSLNINEAKASLKAAVSGPEKRTKTYGLKREKKPKEPPPPRRASMRIRRLDPLGIPLPELPKEEKTTLSDQFRQVNYYSKPLTRYGLSGIDNKSSGNENDHRKPSGPLEMTPSNSMGKDVCKNAVQNWYDLSEKYSKTKITIKSEKKEVMDLSEYEKKITSLSIQEHHASKVTPNRIFSLTIHPMESKILVIAGSKWGRIGIWDVDSEEGQDGVYLFEPHTRPINVVSVCPLDYTKIYSCSYDGTLRCGDLEKQVFTEAYAEPEDDNVSLNAFAWIAKSQQTVVVGKNDYSVGVVDIRSGKEEQNFVAHGKLVRWVDCHPINENLIATSCQDGSVATWDLRKAKTIKSKLSEIRCGRVTSSAFFSPKTGEKLLTTSLDDTIRVYDVNSNGHIQSPAKCMLKHFNQTGRWLTKFRATWDPKNDDYFVVGSMARPRAIDFYTSAGKGSKIAQMSHENLSSITSLNIFHPTLDIVVGGNSSGKVFLWK